MRYIALVVVTVALSLAFASSAKAHSTALNNPAVFVTADVLFGREAPRADAKVTGRYGINRPFFTTGRPDQNGFVEVYVTPYVVNAEGVPKKSAWVARRFTRANPLSHREVNDAIKAAIAAGDGAQAVRWAERLVALGGRSARNLNTLARAAGLAGDDARVQRLHLEAESGRTLIAACTGGMNLLGELYHDGRFVPAVMPADDTLENSAKWKRQRARLERLRAEVAMRPFFAPATREDMSTPIRYPDAKLEGLDESALAEKNDFSLGIKVLLGPCHSNNSIVATRVLPTNTWKAPFDRYLMQTAVSPDMTKKLMAGLAPQLSKPVVSIGFATVPHSVKGQTPIRFERAVVFVDAGHLEPDEATTWSLHDGGGKRLLQLEFSGRAPQRNPWIRANPNATLRILPWGDVMQNGANLIIIDAKGKPRRYEIPSVAASGC